MKGHGTKFGQKMDQAVAALISCRNVDQAARLVGISTNTLQRWMRTAEFQAAYREARHRVVSDAVGRMQDAAGVAANTVLRTMLDPNAPPATRLRAAEVVLDQAAKLATTHELQDRVAELEHSARPASKPRGRASHLTLLSVAPSPQPAMAQAQIAAPSLDNAETDDDAVE